MPSFQLPVSPAATDLFSVMNSLSLDAGGIVNNTLRPHVPSYCDTEWKLLMEQCWAPDPVVRPSFTEIAGRLRVMSAACQTKPQGHQVTK